MKIFSLPPQENWICDRFLKEWNQHNPDILTHDITQADVNWILAGWQWNRIPPNFLREKTTVLTVHHIVPDKFNKQKEKAFRERDKFVDWYHVPCDNTSKQIVQYTDKPIFVQPFWMNQFLWYEIENKKRLRKKLNLLEDAYIVGSFQRDTEGHDLQSPKLEKGPDRLVDIIKKINDNKKVLVVLAGPRRQYVINRLRGLGIAYKNFEFTDFTILNELYNCLDLYIVSSRHEGGPQSIVECALTKTPIISTKVGIAPLLLTESHLYDSVQNFESAWATKKDADLVYNNAIKYTIPSGFKPFREFFRNIKK